MNSAIEQLADWIKSARTIVALTGAGISTASGIPDFRSASGIYSDEHNVNVFDLDAFRRDPSIFYNFARDFYPQVRDAQPNAAHRALAGWKHVTVVTQNVDDYHQRAGSSPVYCVHGNHIRSTCQSCGGQVETEALFPVVESGGIPECNCGGVYKPNITFFGEMLPEYDWQQSVQAMCDADLVLVLGTSLVVYPAASLPDYRPRNAKLAIINRDPTPLDRDAQLVIHDDLCAVMDALI
ncbi:MAG: NAD-dependent deacylase [Kiritimatiellales bacterium]|nr:NAD-dependent deacylase [Pontiella sp.]NNJ71087.1 NAD-dependent deacylase [Kiritimatiellales bacterium]